MILNKQESCLYWRGKEKNKEIRYIEYFNNIDHKSLYFSYEIDITNSIQNIFQGIKLN